MSYSEIIAEVVISG